ncbi:DinB family protein [Gordonia sp. VNK21]|uniref:DinB family protein n=1 Tax=Gordonia sp. VNK21 TaxID=3382483 RepID=UPI0038D47E2F
MAIEPETKDWTWVLERPCADCGFDAATVVFDEIPAALRANSRRWQRVLADGGETLTRRPDEATWSPLEYAAHVRDVFRIILSRVELMLVIDDPQVLDWSQDATQVEQRYNAQSPATVSRELGAAGEALAVALELVSPGQRSRPGRRSDGAAFTVESIAKYCLHDVTHHAWDVAAH